MAWTHAHLVPFAVAAVLTIVALRRRWPRWPDDRFDAAVSVAAIDHLNQEGVSRAFHEINRVLKPGGQFLLIVLNVDFWVRLAYPMPHGHGYFNHSASPDRWRSQLEAAGFEIQEEGTRPATLYVLAKTALTP